MRPSPAVPSFRPRQVGSASVSGGLTGMKSVPSGSFPEGSYMIRVECYRQNQALHYSQHQSKIYIER